MLHARHQFLILYQSTQFLLDHKEAILILILKLKKREEEPCANIIFGLDLGSLMVLCEAHISSVVYSNANFRISPQPSFTVTIIWKQQKLVLKTDLGF